MRELEALGYSTLFVPDHFDEGLGPITAMATAAVLTTTLKVGALVFDCDYRHPAVLARELASIDLLSEGRLEVGLGAGWKKLDYDRSGIPMEAPKVRVDRMIEHTKILKALFAEDEPVDFAGEHYRITDLPGTPRPYTPGGPPFIIGGGQRRVLRFAGARRRHRRRERVDPLGRGRHRRRARRDARAHRPEGRLAARRRRRALRLDRDQRLARGGRDHRRHARRWPT